MARCHDVADAGAIAFNLVIHEVMERGRSVARHPYEFRCERGRHQLLSKPPRVRVREGLEAVGEPIAPVVAVRTMGSLRRVGGRY